MPKTMLLDLAKRLADYVRMTIEIGGLKPDSPIAIAYRDFMEEWDAKENTAQATKGLEDVRPEQPRSCFRGKAEQVGEPV